MFSDMKKKMRMLATCLLSDVGIWSSCHVIKHMWNQSLMVLEDGSPHSNTRQTRHIWSCGLVSSPTILLGFCPAILWVWWRGAELRVRVCLPFCDVWPDGGTRGGSSSSVVLLVGGGRVEVVFEEIKILSRLGDGEPTKGALQLFVVNGRYGDWSVAVWLCLPSSGPAGPLPYLLWPLCSGVFSGAVPVGSVSSVSLSGGRRGQSNQWAISHRTWSVAMVTLGGGLSLLVEVGADGLPWGRRWTGWGRVVPVSSGTSGTDHFWYQGTLLSLVTWWHPGQGEPSNLQMLHFHDHWSHY